MTILLTGAGGFVGSHVLESLLANTDYDIICTDSFNHNGSMDKIVDICKSRSAFDRVEVITHDLTVPFSRVQKLKIKESNYIINVASKCQVDESIHTPESFILNNVKLIVNMLETARELNLTSFIQMSTDEVYGPHEPIRHNPSSPYSASKAAQEDICNSYFRTFKIPVTIINSCNLIGERQSNLAFVPQVISKILDEETISIHQHNGIIGKRNYTYVKNVSNFISYSTLNRLYLPIRIPLQGQVTIDNLQLVKHISAIIGKKFEYRLDDVAHIRPGYDVKYDVLPYDKRWIPEIDFYGGLQYTVDWFMGNKEWL